MRFQQRQRLRQRPDDLGAIIDFEWLLKGIQRTLVITDGSSEKLLHGRPAVVPSSVDTLTTRPVERVLAIFPPRFDQAGADCGLSQPAAPEAVLPPIREQQALGRIVPMPTSNCWSASGHSFVRHGQRILKTCMATDCTPTRSHFGTQLPPPRS